MKLWKKQIYAATKKAADKQIIEGFLSADNCIAAEIIDSQPTYCTVELTLSDGRVTTLKCWYTRRKKEVGRGKKRSLQKWQPEYSVQPDGSVYDADDNYVGTAIVRVTLENQPRYRSDYDSFRTNTAVPEIYGLDSEDDFNNAVDSFFMNRYNKHQHHNERSYRKCQL